MVDPNGFKDERWPHVDGKPTKIARWTFDRGDHTVFLTGRRRDLDDVCRETYPEAPPYILEYRVAFWWAYAQSGEFTTTNKKLAFTLARLWVIGGNHEGMGWRERDWLPWEVLP